MKEWLQRHWIKIWWLVSVGLILFIGYLARLVVKDPPFTDWHYIISMALCMPSVMLPLFLYMLRNGSETKP